MTKIIGHRGAAGLAPENTIASFEKALAIGVDEIELDVRVTKDDVPVLCHDRYLRNASGKKLRSVRVKSRTLTELRKDNPLLATLDEAVAFVNRRTPLYVEVKPGMPTAPIIAAFKQYLTNGWQPTDFLLASFSQKTLRELHAALPNIEKIVIERFSSLRAVRRARELGTRRLSFNQHNVWWFFIRSMNRSGFHLTTFTLNNVHKAERWAKYGLYGVATDYPDRYLPPAAAESRRKPHA